MDIYRYIYIYPYIYLNDINAFQENRKVGEILSLKTNPNPIPGKILDSSVYV